MSILDNLEAVYQWQDPERFARYGGIPKDLSNILRSYVTENYPEGIYTHQECCIERALQGESVALCTSTGSGKSLAFTVPVLDALIQSEDATALFVYPAKALANDQMFRLQQMGKALGLEHAIWTFHGDVGFKDRQLAIQDARVLVVTPDVLHTTILRRSHEKDFSRFFRSLRYVVLDECHMYTGVFGANMAYVLRRLRQCVAWDAGKELQFLMASATVGEVSSFLHRLTGLKAIRVIAEEENGSPLFGKDYRFITPPKGMSPEELVQELMMFLADQKKQFVVFCQRRKSVESLMLGLQSEAPLVAERVKPYRSGYEVQDRVKIEDALRSGALHGVISTSALELGVDVPDLDYCLMLGVPSSKNQFGQRAGRVGRARAGTVFVLKGRTAHDAYYFGQAEEFSRKPYEPPILSLENPRLLLNHFACAQKESEAHGKKELDPLIFGPKFVQMGQDKHIFGCEVLSQMIPHFYVNIRQMDDPSFDILFEGRKTRLGTIPYSKVLLEAYPGAIYLHLGRSYEVTQVAQGRRTIYVKPASPKSATRPIVESRVFKKKGTVLRSVHWPEVTLIEAPILVFEQTLGYTQLLKGQPNKNHEYEKPLKRLTLTTGIVLEFYHGDYNSLLATAKVLCEVFPLVRDCAREDVYWFGFLMKTGLGCIYLYDRCSGGLDIVTADVPLLQKVMEVAIQRVRECSCNEEGPETGCIHCIAPNTSSQVFLAHREKVLALLVWLQEKVTEAPASLSLSEESMLEKSANKMRGLMLNPGARVFTGDHQEAIVVQSKRMSARKVDAERLYTIEMGDGTKDYIGSSLTVMEGDIVVWCLACGKENLSLTTQRCPSCGTFIGEEEEEE